MNLFTVKAAGLFLTLSLSTPAFANYYALLEKQFKASSEAIALTDFKDYGHPNAKACVEYTIEHPMDESAVRIGLHSRESDGPGPGLPPIEVIKLLVTTYDSQDLGAVADATTLELKSKEIKVSYANGEKFVTLLRKQGEFIHFKRTRTWKETVRNPRTGKDVETTKTADLYGYCYPRPITPAQK